ncbi:acyl-CoA dehydrogenase family protein [Novosphingobium album (ex Hu et al. 2023)]|uniref:Acyl-CoA dehydrogenase family protein n=1 Tax=Novosphingobium album (ex Hu et al. 2023) TaxID=2930093 RepID=A0ABT0B0Z3_9SPHN|nr:acyl-CoA dehydrogenase family protein [Novosphingobium album (ex Hu et al. 2023)]MCJ2178733.1 acyl-CoA dehydrogenase family protein [Novosphingobium album (ex Hu et al. 2023)]
MNFDLNEDEEMLKALTERFVTDHYDHESRRTFLGEANGFSSANWELLGELGLIAAPFPEEFGGLGLDATGIATVFEALGRGLVVEPLAETVVLAGRLFALTAPESLRDEWIEPLITGEKRLALAHAEPESRGRLPWVQTSAQVEGDTFILSGTKPYCIASGGVDGFIVTARKSGNPGDRDGIGLFLVPADAAGLSARTWQLADGSLATALTLDSVSIPAGNQLEGGLDALDGVEVLTALARSAEALGIMERLFAETLDYLRTRDQFGAALGSFQAIQHRMVAQYASIEQSRALLNLALVNWGSDGFEQAVYGARAYIADVSLTLGHEMIQFHGGMGVTDELAVGGGHKRLLVLSRWPEGPQAALDRYAGLLN